MLLHQCILVSSTKNVNTYNKTVTSIDLTKVKQSHYRPGVAQRIPGSWGSHISWQWHRMVVGCQPYTSATFTPQEMLLVLISVRGWVDPRAMDWSYTCNNYLIAIMSPKLSYIILYVPTEVLKMVTHTLARPFFCVIHTLDFLIFNILNNKCTE